MSEQFEIKVPREGDHIRIWNGRFWHHGICVGEGRVVHFCAPDGGSLCRADEMAVRLTDMADFCRGGIAETRRYSVSEMLKKRSPHEVAAYASSCVGRTGYDILKNNCEHLVTECEFGTPTSSQVDEVRASVRKLLGKGTPAYVYGVRTGELALDDAVLLRHVSPSRLEKIQRLVHISAKKQSLGVELSIAAAMKAHMANYTPPPVYARDERGRPFAEGFMSFSLSHTQELSVCAVSEDPIGVDVEINRGACDPLAQRVLYGRELEMYEQGEDKARVFLEGWTSREAAFKLTGGAQVFYPEKTHLENGVLRVLGQEDVHCGFVNIMPQIMLCVASFELPDIRVKLFSPTQIKEFLG